MNTKSKLKVSIETFGCQMNQYDSEVASGLLEQAGFEIVVEGSHPERSEGSKNGDPSAKKRPQDDRTDVYLMNTCSVREHAEDKVYSRLGAFGKVKRTNPDLIVGLMGCMVEEHKEKLFKRFPCLDLMVGTRNIRELPALIDEVKKTRKQTSRIKQDGISIEYTDQIKREGKFHAWLPIMTGCDKVCTYCIVPITRGSEVSMPAREVYREASRLVGEGVRWITLLGQNVNSYRGAGAEGVIARSPTGATKQSQSSGIASASFGMPPRNDGSAFPELLDMLCEIEGLMRISFTTSHPHDATEELYRVIARNPKISRRFHLPLQSGSDAVLRRMKRLHTYQEYKAKVDLMREIIPDISITTDIIAGFSGETEEDHQATIRALEEIRYDDAYIYKYSVRQQTPAAKLADDVPFEIKGKRNQELLAIQKRITAENNQKYLSKIVSVFVEEINSRRLDQVMGRTDQDKTVVFEGTESLIGSFQKLRLSQLENKTFVGTTVE